MGRRTSITYPDQTAIANAATRVQDLHQEFLNKSANDTERLGIDQQKLLLDRARTLEALVTSRAKLETQYRNALSSAAATEKLSALDPSSNNFEKSTNQIIQDHPEALGSTGFQKLLADRRADRVNFVKSMTPDIISNPIAAETFDSAYSQTGSAVQAANAAKAQLGLYNNATKLAASPHLSPDDVSKFYDTQTGQYNLDPTVLNQMQVKSDTAEKAAQFAKENKTTVDDAWTYLKSSANKTANLPPLDPRNAPLPNGPQPDSKPMDIQRNNAWWNALKTVSGQQNAPVGASAPAPAAAATPNFEDEAKRLFGTPATPGAPTGAPAPAAPAAAVASGVPGGDELANAEK